MGLTANSRATCFQPLVSYLNPPILTLWVSLCRCYNHRNTHSPHTDTHRHTPHTLWGHNISPSLHSYQCQLGQRLKQLSYCDPQAANTVSLSISQPTKSKKRSLSLSFFPSLSLSRPLPECAAGGRLVCPQDLSEAAETRCHLVSVRPQGTPFGCMVPTVHSLYRSGPEL